MMKRPAWFWDNLGIWAAIVLTAAFVIFSIASPNLTPWMNGQPSRSPQIEQPGSLHPGVGQVFLHWYDGHKRAQEVCGPPTGNVTWQGHGHVTQRMQGCTLFGHEWYSRGVKPPTATPRPTAAPTPYPTLQPTPTATCGTGGAGCDRYVLDLINEHRASVGVPPLTLDPAMSGGPGASCPGAFGHSVAMAESGTIWHVNSSYSAVSFPNGLCTSYSWAGENVGYGGAPPVASMLSLLDSEMWSEPHDVATCAASASHSCNMISPKYTRVGIGVYVASGYVWLTENFAG